MQNSSPATPKPWMPILAGLLLILGIGGLLWACAQPETQSTVVVATRTEIDWAMKRGKTVVWAPSKLVLDAVDGPKGSDPVALATFVLGKEKTAWSPEKIQETVDSGKRKVVNLADIAQLVPTLTVSTNLSPFATGIRIRGIGTSQNNIALEASVAFVVDGVYLGRSGLGFVTLSSIFTSQILIHILVLNIWMGRSHVHLVLHSLHDFTGRKPQ